MTAQSSFTAPAAGRPAGSRPRISRFSPSPAQTPAAPAIAAHGLTRTHAVPGRSDAVVHALAGVDLELAEGSFTAVVGASGSGKSTLLQCATGQGDVVPGVQAGDEVILLEDDAHVLGSEGRQGARAGSVLVMDSGRIAAHVPGGSAEVVSQAILAVRGRAA